MPEVTRQSRKETLWLELERLRLGLAQAQAEADAERREAGRLREELARLEARVRFAQESSDRARAAGEKLEILASLTRDLASFDLDGVLEVLVQRIPFLVGARYASVYVYEPERRRLVLKQHTHGREIDRVVELDHAPSSLMAQAVRGRRTLCIDDLGRWTTPEGDLPERPHAVRYRTASCVVTPLIAGGEVQGVLNLADRYDEQPFDAEQQLALIRQARDLVAVALRNAALIEAAERAVRTCRLTGLMNRQAFVEALDRGVTAARAAGRPLALLLLNLRGVRLINANHGHHAGDAVIVQATHLLSETAGPGQPTGRTGGSELAWALPGANLAQARAAAQRILRHMGGSRFMIGSDTCTVGVTVGVAVAGDGHDLATGDDLLRAAGEALDRARERGLDLGA